MELIIRTRVIFGRSKGIFLRGVGQAQAEAKNGSGVWGREMEY
jgi:hypothetical protein